MNTNKINKINKIYVLNVRTKLEKKYIALFHFLHPDIHVKLYFPQRELYERHSNQLHGNQLRSDQLQNKKMLRKLLPIFPGYVFVELDDVTGDVTGYEDIKNLLPAFRQTVGFIKFLKSNYDISPLKGRDLELVSHFIKKPNAVAEVSKVYFSSDDRIVVISGALTGLEGSIIRVDKRKGRAKLNLDLWGEKFTVDLSFQEIKSEHLKSA